MGIYESNDVPVILVASNDQKPDMTELSEQGVADCITKPFNVSVLKAKVWTQFKRGKRNFSFRAISRFEAIGDYLFNFDTGEYSVAGKKVRLNRLEQCLLRNLVENKGIVLKKKALVEKLRSESRAGYIDEAILAEVVHMLNNKLNARNYIKTVYGIGYLWALAEDKNKSG